jgi:AraC family transcriptional regulator
VLASIVADVASNCVKKDRILQDHWTIFRRQVRITHRLHDALRPARNEHFDHWLKTAAEMTIPLYNQVTLGTARRITRAAEFIFTLCEHSPNLDLTPHGHSRLSICHVIEGGYIEGGHQRDYECVPGVMTVKLSGQEHWNRIGHAGCLSLAIEIDSSRVDEYSPLFPQLSRQYVTTMPAADFIARRIYRELQFGELTCPLALEESARDLLLVLAARRATPCSGRPAWLHRVRELLHSNEVCYDGLKDLAERVGVHHVHLARSFRLRFGMTVGSYLRAVRVQQAQTLLETSDRSIAEIANTVGFADQAHLTRVFRRAIGVTPAAFRRRCRERR